MNVVDVYESWNQNRSLIKPAVSDKYVNKSSASPFQLLQPQKEEEKAIALT